MTLLPGGRSARRHGRSRAGAAIGPDVTLTDTTVGARSRVARAVCNSADASAPT